MAGVDVIALNYSGEEVLDSKIYVLGFGQIRRRIRSTSSSALQGCLATDGVDTILWRQLKHIVAKISKH